MVYEHKQQKPLSRPRFIRRVCGHFALATLPIGLTLGFGILGYHGFAHLKWIDSLLNASMILGGMGPVDTLQDASDGAKIFASIYALFSGLVFIAVLGLILAPFVHRLMHRFHFEDE